MKEGIYKKKDFYWKSNISGELSDYFQVFLSIFTKDIVIFFSYFAPWFLKPSITHNSKMTDFSDIVF